MTQKLEAFRALLEKQLNERGARVLPDLHKSSVANGYPGWYRVQVKPLQKYIRVSVLNGKEHSQETVRYFVDMENGDVYGAESWRKPNFKRKYGNLDTITEWDWSDYYAVSLKGVDTLVPKNQRKG